jgi:hypothetical protein
VRVGHDIYHHLKESRKRKRKGSEKSGSRNETKPKLSLKEKQKKLARILSKLNEDIVLLRPILLLYSTMFIIGI